MTDRKTPLVTPGEILLHEFLSPLGISQNKIAKDIGVPVSRIGAIIKNGRAITADTALRLGAYFGTTADVWMNLQKDYDLKSTNRKISSTIRRIKPVSMAAAA